MPIYDVFEFDSQTLISSDKKQVSVTDRSRAPVIRIGLLDNGAKYDADGTADADLSLGSYSVRYQLIGSQGGTTTLNTLMTDLEGLRGKHGTLKGYSYGSNGATTTKTCTARCANVIVETIDSSGVSMHYTSRNVVYVTMVWELLTYWA